MQSKQCEKTNIVLHCERQICGNLGIRDQWVLTSVSIPSSGRKTKARRNGAKKIQIADETGIHLTKIDNSFQDTDQICETDDPIDEINDNDNESLDTRHVTIQQKNIYLKQLATAADQLLEKDECPTTEGKSKRKMPRWQMTCSPYCAMLFKMFTHLMLNPQKPLKLAKFQEAYFKNKTTFNRRFYDILTIMVGLGLMRKIKAGRYSWTSKISVDPIVNDPFASHRKDKARKTLTRKCFMMFQEQKILSAAMICNALQFAALTRPVYDVLAVLEIFEIITRNSPGIKKVVYKYNAKAINTKKFFEVENCLFRLAADFSQRTNCKNDS